MGYLKYAGLEDQIILYYIHIITQIEWFGKRNLYKFSEEQIANVLGFWITDYFPKTNSFKARATPCS